MAQMLCYNYLKLWCILYAVLACIRDCKARPGMLFSCAKSRPVARTITQIADDDADDDRDGGGGGEDSADDDDGDA